MLRPLPSFRASRSCQWLCLSPIGPAPATATCLLLLPPSSAELSFPALPPQGPSLESAFLFLRQRWGTPRTLTIDFPRYAPLWAALPVCCGTSVKSRPFLLFDQKEETAGPREPTADMGCAASKPAVDDGDVLVVAPGAIWDCSGGRIRLVSRGTDELGPPQATRRAPRHGQGGCQCLPKPCR
jgi:hypothetical protein